MEKKPHFLTDEEILKMMRKTIREQRAVIDAARKYAKILIKDLKQELETTEEKQLCRGTIDGLAIMRNLLRFSSSEIKEAMARYEKSKSDENEGKS